MIEGTFYTDETNKFYDLIHEGKSYFISKVEISHANKKFTSIKHDFRLIVKLNSEFTEAHSDGGEVKPKSVLKQNIVSIIDIINGNSGFTIDVEGVIVTHPTHD